MIQFVLCRMIVINWIKSFFKYSLWMLKNISKKLEALSSIFDFNNLMVFYLEYDNVDIWKMENW